MRRLVSIVSLSAIALTLALLSPTQARKPDNPGGGGGGGGGGDVPGGTVYIHHDGDVWAMNPDGSNRVRLPQVTGGDSSFSALNTHPSYFNHGDERWFVRIVPDPLSSDYGVCAISESGITRLLFSSEDADIISPPVWTPDDLSVSFIGQRWEFDESGAPVGIADAGLYTVDIDYDESGAVAGPVPGSLTLVADLSPELRIDPLDGFSSSGQWAGHSWSPDGSMATFGVRIQESSPWVEEIWIVDLQQVNDPYSVPAGALFRLASGAGVGWPEWSSDGRRIGYWSFDGTVVYDIVRDSSKTLKRTPNGSWGTTYWSPDGSYFVTYHWDNFSGYDGIFRFTANLSGKSELTAGLCPPDAHFDCILQPLGWRE